MQKLDYHIDYLNNATPKNEQWYVVHCTTKKEQYASQMITYYLGLTTYLPERKYWVAKKPYYSAFFPGYFFIQGNVNEISPSQINATPGVIHLLECDGIPQTVPLSVLQTIHEELNRINALNSNPSNQFHTGDTLRFRNGPFSGLEMIFTGSTTSGTRVRGLLNLLGKATKVEAEVNSLEKTADNAHTKRIRYTRGKGRKIHYDTYSSEYI